LRVGFVCDVDDVQEGSGGLGGNGVGNVVATDRLWELIGSRFLGGEITSVGDLDLFGVGSLLGGDGGSLVWVGVIEDVEGLGVVFFCDDVEVLWGHG